MEIDGTWQRPPFQGGAGLVELVVRHTKVEVAGGPQPRFGIESSRRPALDEQRINARLAEAKHDITDRILTLVRLQRLQSVVLAQLGEARVNPTCKRGIFCLSPPSRFRGGGLVGRGCLALFPETSPPNPLKREGGSIRPTLARRCSGFVRSIDTTPAERIRPARVTARHEPARLMRASAEATPATRHPPGRQRWLDRVHRHRKKTTFHLRVSHAQTPAPCATPVQVKPAQQVPCVLVETARQL
jgi:hypothetical protein